MAKARTLYDKIWDDHVVEVQPDGTLPSLHRPSSRPRGDAPAGVRGPAHGGPQGPRAGEDAGRRRSQHPDDRPRSSPIRIPRARRRSNSWRENAKEFGLEYYDELRHAPGHRPRHRARAGLHAARHDDRLRRQPHGDARRVRRAGARHRHVRGRARAGDADADPEEVEEHARHRRRQARRDGVTAKDIILAIIGEIGTAGGTGYVIEYAGEAIRALSMEGRMTVCNMSIEGGARAGLIAPDEKTFAYLKGRPKAPKGAHWDAAVAYWETLQTDEGAHFDTRGAASTPPSCRRSSPGAPAPRTSSRSPARVPTLEDRQSENKRATRSSARSTTWA